MMKTHEQFADDLALYALGEMAGSDRQEFEEHLHTCAACRRELQALRGDLGLLGLSSSGPQPPARSKERLLQAIAAEPRRAPAPAPVELPRRSSWLAWVPAVIAIALFFITLIFPIQFDRQWITIGWALEGTALLWLFHRVPHPGLQLTGVGLLIAAFLRLAFNPAVLDYHPRAAIPI